MARKRCGSWPSSGAMIPTSQGQVQETPHGRRRPQSQFNLQVNYVSRIDRFVGKATSLEKYRRDGCCLSHIEK